HLAVVVGPGSFTGIRVGISAAQGINLATNKPLYGVSALEAQAYAISLLCANSKKNIRAIIKNAQGFYTQLFDFNLLPLSGPTAVRDPGHATSSTHMDCNLNASHAGLLVHYRLKNKQKLKEVEALYLNEPQAYNTKVFGIQRARQSEIDLLVYYKPFFVYKSSEDSNRGLVLLTKSRVKRDLVYAYQILSYLKLDDHTYTHLSYVLKIKSRFIFTHLVYRFDEVNENSLMRVSLDGNVIEGTEYQYNKTGYIIHGFVYQARKDIQAIFHLHTPSIVAVSSLKDGLLPISQWALHFYNKISYHNYDSLALSNTEGKRLIADLKENFVMLMRNHGSITCGRTIQEAMFYTYHLEQACKTQCLTLAMNRELSIPSEEICSKAVKDLLSLKAILVRGIGTHGLD
ncbi:putative aldolase class 2 protein RP493, partial [Trichonephila clavata]